MKRNGATVTATQVNQWFDLDSENQINSIIPNTETCPGRNNTPQNVINPTKKNDAYFAFSG